ncbi:MAG: DUF1549 domain-containing protein [Rubripirellula sp.]
MTKLKTAASTALRWSWFILLVMFAFGYLAAGLSNPIQRAGDVPELTPQSDETIDSALAALDERWQQSLDEKGLESAAAADWLTVCRRMSLALVGNGLSLEEIRQLEQYPEADRETIHLSQLLSDPRYHYYWAERWSRYLVGTDGGQFVLYRRRRFRVWLSEVFASNRPYDQMVRDLITAEGLWTDKPEVNFLTATFDSNDGSADPIRLAARTSRAFLGLRIDCLQCHNDFLGNVNLGDVDEPREGLQTDFHQLAAFYTSAKTNGLQGIRNGEVDYDYKYLDATEETSVEAAVPYSPELLPADGDPRDRLATWVTHPENRQAARSAVSHVWALMFGKPIGEAVDNLPLDSECDPMLEFLADDFVQHDFDMQRLIRLIAGSSAFRVDSRADFEVTYKHENAHAVFPLVRLRPEQVAGSVIQAARIKKTDRESSLFLQLITATGVGDFVKQYGDVGEDEFSADSITITQRLLMMNGSMLKDLVNFNPVLNTSGHVQMFAKENSHAVDTVYLCALNRYPTATEKQHFVGRLDESEDRTKAIEDLVWVLLNSSELAWNH